MPSYPDATLKSQIRPHKKFAITMEGGGSKILYSEYPWQKEQTRQEQTAFHSALTQEGRTVFDQDTCITTHSPFSSPHRNVPVQNFFSLKLE